LLVIKEELCHSLYSLFFIEVFGSVAKVRG
jgi:hypothetical protein